MMGIFCSNAEDYAILRQVKNKLDRDLFDTDEKLVYKIEKIAPELRAWVNTNVPWRLQFTYRKWINYYVGECKSRLKDNKHWREVDEARPTLPKMPDIGALNGQ